LKGRPQIENERDWKLLQKKNGQGDILKEGGFMGRNREARGVANRARRTRRGGF